MKTTNFFYGYHINFYDECKERLDEEFGFVNAYDYCEALAKIEQYYGSQNINKCEIKIVRNDILMISKKDYETIFDNNVL